MRCLAFLILITTVLFSCTKQQTFVADFNNTHDRIWIGKDFWSIPLEDWKIEDGKICCTGAVPESKVNILTQVISPGKGKFKFSVRMGVSERGDIPGTAGVIVGVKDWEDPGVKAACYFGKGIKAGISLSGYAFLGDQKVDLPEGFDPENFLLTVSGSDKTLSLEITDINKLTVHLDYKTDEISGIVAIANNITLDEEKKGNSKFWFDDISLSGSKIKSAEENAYGPVLWTMYTLNKGTVKLMALLPPVGMDDNQDVSLQVKNDENWVTAGTEKMEPDSRTAIFKLTDWDETKNVDFRILYVEKGKDRQEIENYYDGVIRRDPVDHPLKVGALTCQFWAAFPYSPLVNNLTELNPDLLYFSGDQIYEPNGGYPIKRSPEEESILNYLGKYYMFGWAFGDLMRDRPTICTPDDHDVFHGNLWGEGGIAKPEGAGSADTRGFIQTVKMVNVVNRTQCGQLPDPYNPTPIEQGMSVWYTDINYGRVSFAIISDRIFKSSPERVFYWDGRHDHLKEQPKDISVLDKSSLKMLGDRQMDFLNHWIEDWKNVDMKVLLSQTVFANVATHHGQLEDYLIGDLDSGGWPKSARDRAIKVMRKAGVFHISGDQHLPSLVQYGLSDFRDAGWCFCTPAISNMYLRWFLPDEVGVEYSNRPEHGYPNTGYYTDAFGNKNYVYAVGNPGKITVDRDSRFTHAQIRSSGFGFVTFDQVERTINIDSWRFIADVEDPNPIRDQFPGWPLEITQADNFGLESDFLLPELKINKPNQLVKVLDEKNNELVFICRSNGNSIQPDVRRNSNYKVLIGEGNNYKELKGLAPGKKGTLPAMQVEL
ncbi:MAG: alkaline phosphatase D family protein [Prolixibacteraceae bacterium]|nr:alkaline phosphatase D family protein [Prolixibacteraceae bacterium]MBN2773078.1 alkaline phosphatase D family protein [Prolixibacteraceae bacterium]